MTTGDRAATRVPPDRHRHTGAEDAGIRPRATAQPPYAPPVPACLLGARVRARTGRA